MLGFFFMLLVVCPLAVLSMRELIMEANSRDPSWLAGTSGRMGLANYFSLVRISLGILVPYIYIASPFGKASYMLAFMLLIFALLTDAVDGTIARARGEITKLGKFLDPLCDKVIFYFAFAGMLQASGWTALAPDAELGVTKFLIVFSIVSVVLRDLLILLWAMLFGRKTPEGISACLWDKARFFSLCVWLSAVGLGLITEGSSFGEAMPWLAMIAMLLSAILSWVTFAVAVFRVTNLNSDKS